MQASSGVSSILTQQVSTSRGLTRPRPKNQPGREMMLDLAFVMASSAIVGLFASALYRAVERWVVTSPGIAVVGTF